jgi:hypothetical protein
MIDSEFLGFGLFDDLESFKELANKHNYKGSKNWELPKWEALKLIHPHDWEGLIGELWTDNATSARYTAKKMQLSNGEFTECNQKFHYEEPSLLRLMCKEDFTENQYDVLSEGECQYMILPFGEMNYTAVDTLNTLLSKIQFRRYESFRRPTIEELKMLLPVAKHMEGIESGWYWSSSEGGKFNAFKINLNTGEIYSCKKASDYSDSMAFSIAIVV